MARESLQSALEQIYAQGGTDADARAYAASKGYELRPQEPLGPGHEAPAPWLGAERPGTGQAPLLDPSLTGPASMAGGMAGGALAAPLAVASGPFAPVVEVAGVAMGAEAGRQTARAINYFAQGLTDRRPAVDRWLESLGNMAWDATLQAGGAAAGKAVRAGWGSVLKMLRPGDLGGVERLAAFERLGVKPNAGAVSQRPAVQGTELALAKLPTSGAITGKGLQATQDDLALAAGEIADRISAQARTVQEGGDILQRGIKGKGGFLDRFFGETETSFAAVNKGLARSATPPRTAVAPVAAGERITVGGALESVEGGNNVQGFAGRAPLQAEQQYFYHVAPADAVQDIIDKGVRPLTATRESWKAAKREWVRRWSERSGRSAKEVLKWRPDFEDEVASISAFTDESQALKWAKFESKFSEYLSLCCQAQC